MPSSATPMSAPLPTIAERFADLSQQQAASRLGMWVFLASETLLFAGLFGLWATYRVHYPAGFLVAAQHDTLALGTINTFVLLTSSLLAALAVWAVAHERRGLGLAMVLGTAALGVVFLAIKGLEYAEHVEHGLLPGRYATSPALDVPGARLFYVLYWLMTGVHALHLTAAVVLMLWVAGRVARRRETAPDHARLETCALYWHMVDVVWLFLWPLLYLVR